MANVKAVYIRNTGTGVIGQEVEMADTDAAKLAQRQRVSISSRNGPADAHAVAQLIPSEFSLTSIATVAFTPAAQAVKVGETVGFKVTATTVAGVEHDITDLNLVTITAGDDKATMARTATGLTVTGVDVGTATITATVEGKTATSTVTVSAAD